MVTGAMATLSRQSVASGLRSVAACEHDYENISTQNTVKPRFYSVPGELGRDMRTVYRIILFIALACLPLVTGSLLGQTAPAFSQIVIFGDSLSDTGNVRDRTDSKSGGTVQYPSGSFNYSDGRWTNRADTDPGSPTYVGVWHEQLARTFLNIPAATYSLGGGSNYAFGGATTNDGTHEETVVSPPLFGDVTITIDDMGRQMDDYLA